VKREIQPQKQATNSQKSPGTEVTERRKQSEKEKRNKQTNEIEKAESDDRQAHPLNPPHSSGATKSSDTELVACRVERRPYQLSARDVLGLCAMERKISIGMQVAREEPLGDSLQKLAALCKNSSSQLI
jgi:hypothetical protein